jgi:hypothetical protein
MTKFIARHGDQVFTRTSKTRTYTHVTLIGLNGEIVDARWSMTEKGAQAKLPNGWESARVAVVECFPEGEEPVTETPATEEAPVAQEAPETEITELAAEDFQPGYRYWAVRPGFESAWTISSVELKTAEYSVWRDGQEVTPELVVITRGDGDVRIFEKGEMVAVMGPWKEKDAPAPVAQDAPVAIADLKKDDVVSFPQSIADDGEVTAWGIRGYRVDHVQEMSGGVWFVWLDPKTVLPGHDRFTMVCGRALAAGALRRAAMPEPQAVAHVDLTAPGKGVVLVSGTGRTVTPQAALGRQDNGWYVADMDTDRVHYGSTKDRAVVRWLRNSLGLDLDTVKIEVQREY